MVCGKSRIVADSRGFAAQNASGIGATAAADVEQPFSAVEWDPFGHQARRAERSRMLCRAKLLPAASSAINEALIEALIREYPLAT
jgi:hypothetical protein